MFVISAFLATFSQIYSAFVFLLPLFYFGSIVLVAVVIGGWFLMKGVTIMWGLSVDREPNDFLQYCVLPGVFILTVSVPGIVILFGFNCIFR